ncbi:MAG: glycosyltransferase [Oscillospiraceae bacterium]|nr:glycosyltransferase [Oscillospiraceae bacterium]
MNDLISIIIPVFRVEKYLPRCIESVMAQTYKNIEIILVDDGSPDSSGRICDEYAAKDPRIRVIHKDNGGVSSARNAGLDIAEGKYICFVDSDDYIHENYARRLYSAVSEKNADIASCGFFRYADGVMLKKQKHQYPDAVEYNSSQHFYDLFCNDFRASVPWNKIYRSDIIRENKIKFPEDIRPGEDSLFVARYSGYARCAVFISDALYVYADCETSVCRTFDKRSYFENDEKQIAFLDSIENGDNAPLFSDAVRMKKIFLIMHLMYDNKKFRLKKDMSGYKKFLKENISFFISYSLSLRVKLRFALMAVSPFLFDTVKILYRKLTAKK